MADDLLLSLEQRFECAPDGTVWGPGGFGEAFWNRYLSVFDHVRVLARITDVAKPSDGLKPSGAPRVSFVRIPYYLGPGQFLRVFRSVRRSALAALAPPSNVILRIPSPIASCVVPHLIRRHRPFGVEVVGDPYDVMSPGAFNHPLRPFFRWWLRRCQERECLAACGAAYVTERTLQAKYPCGGYSIGVSDVDLARRVTPGSGSVFTTHYSSVSLGEEIALPRAYVGRVHGRFTLVTTSTLAQMYKGVDILIDAVSRCATSGLDLSLVVIGDGKHRPELEKRASDRGIRERVRFAGFLPRDQVTRELKEADLFVLPSRQEGLPRAMIEAMAQGLPCIGSDVGGIPELLPQHDLVSVGDTPALAAKIQEVLSSAGRLEGMSLRSITKARDYQEHVLQPRRVEFYNHIRTATADWQRRMSGPARGEIVQQAAW